MKTLNEIVKQMLDTHGGGSLFFDNLDAEIRNNDDLLDNFLSDWVTKYVQSEDIQGVILSGKFGRTMISSTDIKYYCDEYLMCHCLVVNGGLRTGEEVEDVNFYSRDYTKENKGRFLFVDDSFYSGKTRNKINEKLNEYNCEIVHTIVLYDGSVDKDENVSSMYRYYDNHDKEEN